MDEIGSKKVSKIVIRRLPRYYRYLSDLIAEGVERISSSALAERMGVTASQIRQDFNCFGGFGQQGYGYNVPQLHSKIGEILGLNEGHKTILLGAGNLGHALANYPGFERRGFKLCGIFDSNPDIIGSEINGIEVSDISDLETSFAQLKPDIAILTVPKIIAQNIADRLCDLGIRGIWNFSYMELRAKEGVEIENVHLSDSLMTLSHTIYSKHGKEEKQ